MTGTAWRLSGLLHRLGRKVPAAPDGPSLAGPLQRLRRPEEIGMRDRVLVVAGALLVLVGVGLIDAAVGRSAGQQLPGGGGALALSEVSAGGSRSSAWYCPGATGAKGAAPVSLIITSDSAKPVQATVRAVSSIGIERYSVMPVRPGAQVTVNLFSMLSGPFLGASVVVQGGGVAVSEAAAGFTGWSVAPCAPAGATSWYLPDGSTAGGAHLFVELLNPEPSAAVVDLSFSDPAGSVSPPAFQGIEVPADGLDVIDSGEHVVSEGPIATTVSAVTGTIVAAELQAGAEGSSSVRDSGMALVLGSPVASPRWSIPATADVAGSQVAFHVFDPAASSAKVRLTFAWIGGSQSVEITVPAGATTVVLPTSVQGIPAGTVYQVSATSLNGVDVVVSRSEALAAAALAHPPTTAFGMVLGYATGARDWLIPALPVEGTSIARMAVVDLSSKPASISLYLAGNAPVPSASSSSAPPPQSLPDPAGSSASAGSAGSSPLTEDSVSPSAPLILVPAPDGTTSSQAGSGGGAGSPGSPVAAGSTVSTAGAGFSGNAPDVPGLGAVPLVMRANHRVAVEIDLGPAATAGIVTMPGLVVR